MKLLKPQQIRAVQGRTAAGMRTIVQPLLLVCSADHLFKIDYRDVIASHMDSGADATVVSTQMPKSMDLSRYLLVTVDGGRVRSVDYKPAEPKGRSVGTEVFAYRPDRLYEALRHLVREGGDLGDYGERLLPLMVDQGSVGAFEHRGHWRDLGTPQAYLDGQLDLLAQRPPLTLDDPDWPIITSMPVRAPAMVRRTAEIDRAVSRRRGGGLRGRLDHRARCAGGKGRRGQA